jgi:hypothetical protein
MCELPKYALLSVKMLTRIATFFLVDKFTDRHKNGFTFKSVVQAVAQCATQATLCKNFDETKKTRADQVCPCLSYSRNQ